MAVPSYHADVTAQFAAGVALMKGVIDDATTLVALSGEPASHAEATTNFGTGAGKRMASVAVTGADLSVSGAGLAAKIVFAGKAGGTAHVAGNPTVLALLDDATSRILTLSAESGSAVISMTETVTFPAFDVFRPGDLTSV